jgi:hypothetical protein
LIHAPGSPGKFFEGELMAKAIKTYEGGIQERIQVAIRSDGNAFIRYQKKNGYGYTWSAWRNAGAYDASDLPKVIEVGFSNLCPTQFNARLPN